MKDIEELIEKKGFFDILFALSDKDKSFNELEASLNLSPNTVLARLREMQRANIVKEILFRSKKGRSRIKYTITENGKETVKAARSIQNDYLRLRKNAQQLEKEKIQKEREIKKLLSSIQRKRVEKNV